jgi:hypothetical protein
MGRDWIPKTAESCCGVPSRLPPHPAEPSSAPEPCRRSDIALIPLARSPGASGRYIFPVTVSQKQGFDYGPGDRGQRSVSFLICCRETFGGNARCKSKKPGRHARHFGRLLHRQSYRKLGQLPLCLHLSAKTTRSELISFMNDLAFSSSSLQKTEPATAGSVDRVSGLPIFERLLV